MTARLTRRGALALGTGTALSALIAAPARAAAGALRIGYQKGGVVALLKGQGLLEQALSPQGIRVDWREFTSGPPLLEALGAGAIDFGHTGDVPPLFALSARQNVVFVGTYAGSPQGSAVLVRKDSPIRTIADLKGRKVAFKRGSSAHNVILQVLRSAGLSLDDITPVDLAPPDAAPAFAQGAVDAWSIWDPYTAIAEQSPDTRVLATLDGIARSWSFLLANGGYARDNGATILTLVDKLHEAGAAADADLEGTVAAVSRATGVDPAVVRVVAERPGMDYADVGLIPPEAVAYEQQLADDFHALGVIPRKLDIAASVWTAPGKES